MDDFDLNMSELDSERMPVQRRVRRHDTPNPRPTEDFEQPEEVYSDMEERKPGRENTRKQVRTSTSASGPKQGRGADSAQRNNKSSEEKASKGKRQNSNHKQGLFRIDRRWQIFFGVLSLVIGCAMLIVLISHIKNGGADQSKAMNMTVAEMTANSQVSPPANVGKSFGAWLSQVLFAESLGLGSLVIAVYLMIVGSCLCAKRKMAFWMLTFKTLLLTVSVSMIIGLVTYSTGSEVFWGGAHGHYVNKYLLDNTGWIGALAVNIILLAAIICTFFYTIRDGWKTLKNHLPSMPAGPISVRHREASDSEDSVDVEDQIPLTSEDGDSKELVQEERKPENKEQNSGFSIDDDGDDPVLSIEEVAKSPKQKVASPSKNDKSELELEVEVKQMEVDKKAKNAVTDPGKSELYDHKAELSHFKMPTLDLLDERRQKITADEEEQQRNKDRILRTLESYDISITSIKATVGPTVTLYEVVPAEGVRIAQIKRLEADIAMSLSAKGIRIIAPIPGKGTVGIEVPNNDPQTVSMRSVLASPKFLNSKMNLPVALGATIQNEVFVADLASMPHALVAGATGQGKSVGLNAIIASLLYKKHPSELKFVLIDPKMVEFSLYSKLVNHYLAKLPDDDDEAIITDTNKVLSVMNSLCVEMDNRYSLLKDAGVRNIEDYNAKFTQRRLNPEKGHYYMPYIVVIIDEFSDLILTAGKDIEGPVTRITQKARAVGIHMIIATQRPSTNVLTGLIKANCPARIAFRVNQMVDSRTILDQPGANQLIGRGDMLYSAGGSMERVQCAFISTDEVERIVDFVDEQVGYGEPYMLPDPLIALQGDKSFEGGIAGAGMDRDPLFDEAARFIVSQSSASTSSLQRRFQIGYNRAGKIMDQMEASGIVGAADGSKPRNVLVDPMSLEQMLSQR